MSDEQEAPKTVPYVEFAKARERIQAAEARVAELEAAAASAAEAFEAERNGWNTDRALFQAGITDPEAQAVAKFLHGRTEGAPEIAEWVGGFASDPTSAPAALRGYLAPATAAEPTPAPATPPASPDTPATAAASPPAAPVSPAAPPAPSTNGHTAPTPDPGGGMFKPGDIRSMSRDQYRNHRAAIYKQLGLSVPGEG